MSCRKLTWLSAMACRPFQLAQLERSMDSKVLCLQCQLVVPSVGSPAPVYLSTLKLQWTSGSFEIFAELPAGVYLVITAQIIAHYM